MIDDAMTTIDMIKQIYLLKYDAGFGFFGEHENPYVMHLW
jgi:hypothetical protein